MTLSPRSLLALLSCATLIGLAGSAQAAKVNLGSATSNQTGTQKLKVDGLGSCSAFFSLNVTFVNKKKWSAVDNIGARYSGKYKQSKGKGGRKFTASFDSKSKKKLEKNLKTFVKDCAGVGSASVDVKKIKVTGTINKDLDSLKLKGKADLEGSAGGDKGEATFSFKTNGFFSQPNDPE